MLIGITDLSKEGIENSNKSNITKLLIFLICFHQRETICKFEKLEIDF